MKKHPAQKKTLLITGAASGIGRAAAERFLRDGHRVYGIDLTPAEERENYVGFTADITDERALQAVSGYFHEHGIRLDAILDVAGIHKMVSLVEGDYEKIKQVVDVNLTGTMLVNRVFHRHLSERGRIVIVTSEVASFAPMPFNGLYNVTKTALDCYAQALRQELNLIGQKVVTIRPGAVDTALSSGSMQDTRELADTTALYRKQAGRFARIAAKFMGTPITPGALARLIHRATLSPRPRFTYQKHRNPGLVLLSLLPLRAQCAVIRLLLNAGGNNE